MNYGDQQLLAVGNKTTFGCKNKIKSDWKLVSTHLLPVIYLGIFLWTLVKTTNRINILPSCLCHSFGKIVIPLQQHRFFCITAALCYLVAVNQLTMTGRNGSVSERIPHNMSPYRLYCHMRGFLFRVSLAAGNLVLTLKLLSFKMMKWVNVKRSNYIQHAQQNDGSRGVK